MEHERMLNRECQPTPDEMAQMIGERAKLWAELRAFVASSYDIPPEVIFGGKKYGWQLHYRKGGRTLVDLYPERDAFTVLVVLGKQESEQAVARIDTLSPNVRAVFEATPPLHDGRWLWIRPSTEADVISIEVLLTIKRKPKKK
jgi:hypothetical protein